MIRNLVARACVVFVAPIAFGAILGCASSPKADAPGQMPLPAGWTQADMNLMTEAGTPGPHQDQLLKNAGWWTGTASMVMAPGMEPTVSPCTCSISPVMKGRYAKTEFMSEMPGMGMFNGFGLSGYDNAAQKYVTVWIDDMSTGIMQGTGEQSADGTTMTWNYTYFCPIRKQNVTMRGIEHITGPNTMTLEMHGTDPKSGKEYKMMHMELTRKS